MKLIDNMKTGRRLSLFFMITLVLILFGFIYAIVQTQTIKKQIDSIYNIQLVSIDYLLQADRDGYQSSISISQAMSDKVQSDSLDMTPFINAINENVAQVDQRFGKFESVSDVAKLPENSAIIEQFHQAYKEVKTITDNLVGLIQEGKMSQAESIYFGAYSKKFEEMRSAMDQFTEISQTQASENYDYSELLSKRILQNIVIIVVIIIFLFIIGAILITGSIVGPINSAVKVLGKISEGDLTVKPAQEIVDRDDEIGDLMKGMSSMIINLSKIVNSIKANASQIASASAQLQSTSEQLSQGANEQAASVEEVSSTMEEISSNISQNSDNAKETEKISEASAKGIEKVAASSKESLQSINTISQKITIINDIAFQTNILALNAAVEAARAGEHGKGFAVVAAEVRKLAERSKVAADEIISLSMRSVDVTNEAGELMDKLLPEVSKTARLVQEISAASYEQSNGADQVNNAIQQLNSITQQNASSSEELASSSEELAAQAETLANIVTFFKVDSSY